ncbi:MAG: M36 family metallopeptidase [Bacteroidia bacterium]
MSLSLLPGLSAQDTRLLRPGGYIDLQAGPAAALSYAQARWAAELGATGLRIGEVRRSPGGQHVTLDQTYAGLPIFRCGIKLNCDPAGLVQSALLRLAPAPGDTPPAFAMTAPEASARLGETQGLTATSVEAGYAMPAGTLRPVYRMLASRATQAFEVLVDGVTGEVLLLEDAATYLHGGPDTTGYGRVFRPDPCTRAEQAYGAAFIDNNDAHSPLLESLMDTVPLRNISYVNDQFVLSGPYVRVEDRASFAYPVATSADGTFFFGRDQSDFEDVMVYYHIDTFQRYVQSLGFDSLQNKPLSVDAHGMGNSDQSAFYENNGNSYILFGDGGVDDAEDADVIIHEYIHALSSSAAFSTNTGLERRGLDEGYADYFTAGYSYDRSVWRWHELFNWDGHNEFWPGRTAVSTLTYPPSGGSIYTYGEIWASTLMQVRLEIGARTCDRLVLQAMHYSFGGMSLRQAALLLLDADSVLYQQVHAEVIRTYLCQRGLLTGMNCVSVGLDEAPAPQHGWRLYPNPATAHVMVDLSPGPQPADLVLRLYDSAGRLVFSRPLQGPGPWAFSPALPAGLYTARLTGSNTTWAVQRLHIQR